MNISQLLLDAWFGDNDSILVLGDFCEENSIYFQGLTNANIEESLYHNLYDYSYDGNGYGSGYGYDNGNGHGHGNGYSDGNGGYGDGNSDGNGYGLDLKEFYL